MTAADTRPHRRPWYEQTHPFSQKSRLRPRPQILPWVLLIAAAFPVRFAVGGSSVSLFEVAVLLGVLPFLVVAITRPVKPPLAVVILAVTSILLAVISVGWSQNTGESILYLISSVEALLAFMMMITFLQDAPPAQIARITGTWVFLLLIPSALLWMRVPGFMPPATLNPTSGDYISYFARLSHPFIGRSNNIAALLVILIIPLAIWAFRTRNRFAGIAAITAFGAVLLTLSRGTLLALLIGVLLYFVVDWKHSKRLLGKGMVALLAAAAVVGFLISGNDVASEFFSGRFTNANVDSRNELFINGQQIIGGNWFRGVGAGVGVDTHNTFLQQMVYFGLLGGLLVGVLLIAVAVSWFRRTDEKWLATAIGIGFLIQIGSFMVESSYEGTLLRPLIWLGWGLLYAWWRAQAAHPEPPAPISSSRAAAPRGTSRSRQRAR